MPDVKRLPIPHTVLEVGFITFSAIVGIIVLGRVSQTGVYARLEGLPVVGALATGVKSAAFQVYNP